MTEDQEKVWDRLKHGIQRYEYEYECEYECEYEIAEFQNIIRDHIGSLCDNELKRYGLKRMKEDFKL